MSKNYGWTGQIRHGLWRCRSCQHWNYFRTATLRLDGSCRAQGCSYRARAVLDRAPRRGGRLRQIEILEYPAYRPPATIRQELRNRNRFERERRAAIDREEHPGIEAGRFNTAGEILAARDRHDLARHGGIFRLEPNPIADPETGERWIRPHTGTSRIRFIRDPKEIEEGGDEAED